MGIKRKIDHNPRLVDCISPMLVSFDLEFSEEIAKTDFLFRNQQSSEFDIAPDCNTTEIRVGKGKLAAAKEMEMAC